MSSETKIIGKRSFGRLWARIGQRSRPGKKIARTKSVGAARYSTKLAGRKNLPANLRFMIARSF